jgi:chorismate mutase-like protein
MKTLEELRQSIDELDQQLLQLIGERLELVKQVGEYKKEHHLAPLQPARWQAVLSDRTQRGEKLGISQQLVISLWNSIHDEALRIEAEVTERKD